MTKRALENGIASVAATGGSTNGVLHMLAIAHEFGIALDIDEFGVVADRTPIVADMQPGGRYTATDMFEAGGIGLVMRELLKRDLLHGDERTVDGRTIAEIAAAAVETPGQKVVVSIETPLKATGGLAILRGTLAPDGCVVKLAGHERRQHRGPARVFDSETDCYAAVRDRRIVPGDVVVIRYEGPVGGPGMQEMLSVTSALVGEGLGDTRRAPHRRAVQRRHPRPDDRPRRPRGRARRPDRPRPRKATRSSSTSTARRSTSTCPADELARRRAGVAGPRPALPRRGHGQVRGPRRVRLGGCRDDRPADDRRPAA